MFDLANITFRLKKEFVDSFIGKQPKWGFNGIGYLTYKRTYARSLPNGKIEEFYQTLTRVVEGCFSIQKNHCQKSHLPWDEEKAQRTAQKMFAAMWSFKFLPPGRGLWTMGTDHVVKHGSAALNNCGFVSTNKMGKNHAETVKPFAFLMDMLMLGVGVGFDTLGAGKVNVLKVPESDFNDFVVSDTREGWVDSVAALLDSYLCKYDHDPKPVRFDYSQVRPAGTPIKGFGGLASGPDPLIVLHDSIRDLLNRRANKPISSGDITDICNMIGRCVVSGNVRRSAELAIGLPDDEEFINLKQDKEALRTHRWASNNSVACTVGMDYEPLARLAAVNGEPGFIWLDNARKYGRLKDVANYKDDKVMGFNPCAEQSLESYELCCLVETFPSNHDSLNEYLDTLKLAYLYSKTVTLVSTHFPETNAVMLRNRRIGCSQSGIIAAFAKFGRRKMLDMCDVAYSFIDSLDAQYSAWLCIPRSIKKTTVKPSGTVSLLAGVSPGIHYPHAEYYIRRIRMSESSPLLNSIRENGYPIVPVPGQNGTVAVEFPVHEKNFVKGKSDVSIEEQLANAADYQNYWSDNSVSITVTFKPEEAHKIASLLTIYEDKLKTVSFLPEVNHGYECLPYEAISKEEYERRFSMIARVQAYDDLEEGSGSSYCDADGCVITP